MEYSEQRNEYVSELGIRKRKDIIAHFEVPTTIEYLHQIEKAERQTLFDLMDDEIKDEIKLLSSIDEDEIGSKMTTNFIAVRAGIGIKQAMHELIEQAADNDNIGTLYVVDEDETLVGL